LLQESAAYQELQFFTKTRPWTKRKTGHVRKYETYTRLAPANNNENVFRTFYTVRHNAPKGRTKPRQRTSRIRHISSRPYFLFRKNAYYARTRGGRGIRYRIAEKPSRRPYTTYFHLRLIVRVPVDLVRRPCLARIGVSIFELSLPFGAGPPLT